MYTDYTALKAGRNKGTVIDAFMRFLSSSVAQKLFKSKRIIKSNLI